jgi:hypothetical protein
MKLKVEIEGAAEDDLLHPADVSRIIGTTEITLLRWRGTRKGPPYVNDGYRVWYRAGDVARWLMDVKPWTRPRPTPRIVRAAA